MWPILSRNSVIHFVNATKFHTNMEDRVFVYIVTLALAAASLGGFSAYLLSPLAEDTIRESHRATSGSAQEVFPILSDDQFSSFNDLSSYTNLGRSIFDSLTLAPMVVPARVNPAHVSIPLPPRRPQHLPRVSNGLLNDAQIASIKNRLKLSPKQAEYWPEVEAALRDVVQLQLQKRSTDQNSAWIMDVNSTDVQRLVQASAPLIRELREDQKRELRNLVRMIGLSTVASYI
jgi:hypothetical protein